MRALMVEQTGRPPKLAVRDVPVPTPGPGEALVKVAACGFCHHDLLVMTGVLRRGISFERDGGVILGHEISGTVADVGPGVKTVRPGDNVVSLLTNACGECQRCRQGREHRCLRGEGIGHGRNGGFAEYVVVSETSVVPIPAEADLTGAALYACPMGVALEAVRNVAAVQPGETVVVTGAGGGLGVHAIQAAVALGGRVLAVTTSPEKLGEFAALGAEEILHTEELDFSELVLALTEDEGADVIIDNVGSALFPSTLRSLAQYGRLVLLGEVAGRSVELNLAEIIFRDARLMGSSGVSRATVRQVAEMVAAGQMKPIVSRIVPLEAAAEAAEALSNRSVLGRLALTPGQ